jgi:hypothetical protein
MSRNIAFFLATSLDKTARFSYTLGSGGGEVQQGVRRKRHATIKIAA